MDQCPKCYSFNTLFLETIYCSEGHESHVKCSKCARQWYDLEVEQIKTRNMKRYLDRQKRMKYDNRGITSWGGDPDYKLMRRNQSPRICPRASRMPQGKR